MTEKDIVAGSSSDSTTAATDPTNDPGDFTTMCGNAAGKKPFLKGKKFAIASMMIALLTIANNLNIVKTTSRIFDTIGWNRAKGDGTDGYVNFTRFIRARDTLEKANDKVQEVQGKPFDVGMLDVAEDQRRAKAEYRAAYDNFVPELYRRAQTNGEPSIYATMAARTAERSALASIDEDGNVIFKKK